MAGFVVIISNIDICDWSGFFYIILFIFLMYVVGYLGLELIWENNIYVIDWLVYVWIFLNVFLILLVYLFILLLECLFGFVLFIILVELMDMNKLFLCDFVFKVFGIL